MAAGRDYRTKAEAEAASARGGAPQQGTKFKTGLGQSYTPGAHHVTVNKSSVVMPRERPTPSFESMCTWRCDTGCEISMTPYAGLLHNIRAGGDELSLQGPFEGAPLITGSRVGDMYMNVPGGGRVVLNVILNTALRGSLLSDKQVLDVIGDAARLVYERHRVVCSDRRGAQLYVGKQVGEGWEVRLDVVAPHRA